MIDLDAFLESGAIIASNKGKVIAGWGKRKETQDPTVSQEPVFYFPDYFLQSKRPWFVFENTKEIEISELLAHLQTKNSSPPSLAWENNQLQQFEETFNDLQSHFCDGTLKKGVPYIFETAKVSLSPANISHMVGNTLNYAKTNPVFVYGFWDGKEGMLGATPEVLLQMRRGSQEAFLETVACAGTCPKDEVEAFIEDPKQLHEHNLVVEGIFESLEPFGTVTRGNIAVLELPTLCHLITPIQLKGSLNLKLDQIVEALHPTPALGAFPKEEGMRWLKKLEQRINRKRYGAPVGCILPNGDASCYVAIRNAQWSDDTISIGAGCGIVPQSQFDLEWNEILLKVKSIKNILGI